MLILYLSVILMLAWSRFTDEEKSKFFDKCSKNDCYNVPKNCNFKLSSKRCQYANIRRRYQYGEFIVLGLGQIFCVVYPILQCINDKEKEIDMFFGTKNKKLYLHWDDFQTVYMKIISARGYKSKIKKTNKIHPSKYIHIEFSFFKSLIHMMWNGTSVASICKTIKNNYADWIDGHYQRHGIFVSSNKLRIEANKLFHTRSMKRILHSFVMEKLSEDIVTFRNLLNQLPINEWQWDAQEKITKYLRTSKNKLNIILISNQYYTDIKSILYNDVESTL